MVLDSTALSVIAIVVAAIAAVSTLLGQERKHPWLVYSGISLTIIAATVQGFAAAKSSSDANQFQKEVKVAQNRALTQDTIVQGLQHELIVKADRIAALSQELGRNGLQLADYVSGGDSQPFVEAHPDESGLMFQVVHRGKYPLYSVRIDLKHFIPGALPQTAGPVRFVGIDLG